MKRLNKKGFTLIELLAVIVILAIVMVITIPSVINSMNAAKSAQLQNAADIVSKWLTDNYELANLSDVLTDAPDATYTTFMSDKEWTTVYNGHTEYNILKLDFDVLEAAGISAPSRLIDSGFASGSLYINAYAKLVDSKICVSLKANPRGKLYVDGDSNIGTSQGCTSLIG